MLTPVLTIHYPDWVCESDRALAHIILRRRSDGPLIVRERAGGKASRSKDWSKLRFTSGLPSVQAVFSDRVDLSRALQDLHACVPYLPEGVVRFGRRRTFRPELPCTCVLSAGIAASPHYSQVGDCQRHAHLLARPCPQPLTALVAQQVRDLVPYLEALPSAGLPMVVDELPARGGHPGKTARLATLAATLARDGKKVALYG